MSSMSFKYFVEFNKDGDIKNLYKSKDECDGHCEEYIVKLIPIKRPSLEEITSATKNLIDMSKIVSENLKRADPEINKFVRELKRKIR